MNDRPLDSDEQTIGFMTYSQVLSELLIHILQENSTGTSIGIFGEWGAGKTTLLKLIEKSLKTQRRLTGVPTNIIWFDAWKYSSGNLLSSLAIIVYESLINSQRFLGKSPRFIKKMVNDYRLLLALRKSIDFSNDDLLDFLKKIIGNNTTVLFIDELDRIPTNDIVLILNALKYLLQESNLVVILALDRKSIVKAVAANYKEKHPDADEDTSLKFAQEYIGKLITIPFELPPIPNPLENIQQDEFKTEFVQPSKKTNANLRFPIRAIFTTSILILGFMATAVLAKQYLPNLNNNLLSLWAILGIILISSIAAVVSRIIYLKRKEKSLANIQSLREREKDFFEAVELQLKDLLPSEAER